MFPPLWTLLFLLHGSGPAVASLNLSPASSLVYRAPALDFTGASWIWSHNALSSVDSESSDVFRALRKVLSFPSSPILNRAAEILLIVDDGFTLYVNGKQIDSRTDADDTWQTAHRYCVQLEATSTLVIAVKGHNAAGAAGLAAAIRVTSEDGKTTDLVSDASWKANADVPSNFERPDFDDSGWSAAVVEEPYEAYTYQTITPAPEITCTPPPHDSSTTPPTSSHNDPNTSKANGGKNTGAIVGGTVGGVVGLAAVAAAIGAILGLEHLKYLWATLMASLFGLFLFGSRRLVFVVEDSEHLPSTQLSLFLTRHAEISDTVESDSEKILVWKVFNIGGAQSEFDVTIPSTYKEGSPQLGFGTVEALDEGNAVKVTNFSPAPAELDEESIWISHNGVDKKTKRTQLLARNGSQKPSRIAVGTIDEAGMNPFLLVEHSAFSEGSEYHAESDLYLHVFRTNAYSVGMYKDTLIKDVEGDRLSVLAGIRVKGLLPLTAWRLSAAGNGKLKLELMKKPRKADVKNYKHECMIHKEAKVKESPE